MRVTVTIELDVDLDAQCAAYGNTAAVQVTETMRELRDKRRWYHAVDGYSSVVEVSAVIDLGKQRPVRPGPMTAQ
jgi:hypothetical protein